MSYEKNIMMSEVLAMRTVKEKSDVPVAQVLYYDDSLTLIKSPYFFMEILEGSSFHSMLPDFHHLCSQPSEQCRQMEQKNQRNQGQ